MGDLRQLLRGKWSGSDNARARAQRGRFVHDRDGTPRLSVAHKSERPDGGLRTERIEGAALEGHKWAAPKGHRLVRDGRLWKRGEMNVRSRREGGESSGGFQEGEDQT